MAKNDDTDDSIEEVKQLIQQLKESSMPIQRERAANLLSHYRSTEVLEALLQSQLHDSNKRVREACSSSLAALLTFIDESEEEEIRKLKKELEETEGNKEIKAQLFDFSKEFEIIRKGEPRKKYDWRESYELNHLFKCIERDKFLPNQQNIKNLINSILLLPIDNSDMGRDVAITLIQILSVTSDETERESIIGYLNNIITNIAEYTPYFGIAEAIVMIFKSSDSSSIRVQAMACLERVIVKKKSLAHLSRYTSDIVKLITFSYDQKIREIALSAYPDFISTEDKPIQYLVDLIINVVRATYEDRLREMGLKTLESLIMYDMLTEKNFERIVKILKSHHPKNIRSRGIEIFTQVILQSSKDLYPFALDCLFNILMNSRQPDICYYSLQNIEKYAIKPINLDIAPFVFQLIEKITLHTQHTLIGLRALNILESIVVNHPECLNDAFVTSFTDCLKLSNDIGVMDQILQAFTKLITLKKVDPQSIYCDLKAILLLSPGADIQELLISIFKELLLAINGAKPEIIINEMIEFFNTNPSRGEILDFITVLSTKETKRKKEEGKKRKN